MNSREYEKYVADVVRNLSISKKGQVYTNRKYPGVRQPGSYEIDVACEVWIDNALFFLIIVECKNWKTPIDRPQVQKLIQTRDAINAHKGAFASPIGYTKEAIKVAKANGVALWVVAKGTFDQIAGGGYAAVSVAARISSNFRSLIYELLEYTGDFYGARIPHYYLWRFEEEDRTNHRLQRLDTISRVKTNLVPESWIDGRISFSPNAELYFDGARRSHDPIMTELIGYILRNLYIETSVNNRLAFELRRYHSILVDAGLRPNLAQRFMNGVINSVGSEPTRGHDPCFFAMDVDAKCNHKKIALLAPSDWLEENRGRIHLPNSEKDLQNNVVWANAIWLLDSAGLLKESSIRF
jgi:hypothetical protein